MQTEPSIAIVGFSRTTPDHPYYALTEQIACERANAVFLWFLHTPIAEVWGKAGDRDLGDADAADEVPTLIFRYYEESSLSPLKKKPESNSISSVPCVCVLIRSFHCSRLCCYPA